MHFATGGTARYTRTAQVLSWTDAAKRIGELLEEGRFATNIEVAAALGHERRRMAEGMVNLYWDTDATAREQGYMPTLAGMCGTTHPACVEAATKALADPDLLPAMLAEYKEFRAASKEIPGLMRFRYRFIDELDALVNEYTMPRRDFDSSMPEVPKVAPFITNDEIAEAMSHGSSFASGKARMRLSNASATLRGMGALPSSERVPIMDGGCANRKRESRPLPFKSLLWIKD